MESIEGPASSRLRAALWLGAVIGAGMACGTAAWGQTIDPALQAPWTFMQQTMPNVPYDLLKAACSEGQLMFYHTSNHEAATSLMEAFEKRFPCIKVDDFEGPTSNVRQRFVSETRAGKYISDIIQDDDRGQLNNEYDEGMLLNYVPANDEAWSEAEHFKRKGVWYSTQVSLVGIAWNSTLVTDEEAKVLSEWKGNLDPEWTGRAGYVDPASGGTSLLPWYIWLKLYGEDYIKGMAKLKPHVFPATVAGWAALASGDIAILMNASEVGSTAVYAAGAPIKYHFPDPAVGNAGSQAIAAHAPHPNAAKLFQEYTLTEEGYGSWQRFAGAPTRTGFKDLRKVAKETWYALPKDFYQYDPQDVSNSNKRVVDIVHNAFR